MLNLDRYLHFGCFTELFELFVLVPTTIEPGFRELQIEVGQCIEEKQVLNLLNITD